MSSKPLLPVLALLLLLLPGRSQAQDLKPGDKLPDCSKIPLAQTTQPYRPQAHDVVSLEDLLLDDGIVILHFTTPRPPKGGAFKTTFVEELSAVQKAVQGTTYPCRPVVVVPFGEKGRQDADTLVRATGEKPWGGVHLYYEPTFPRPGLYRTFRPGAAATGDQPLVTPCTYLLGPDREILATRGPNEGGQL